MKLFKDLNLTEEIEVLDLGIVTAGEKKQFKFHVYNETLAELENIKFEIAHEEVQILSAPEKLKEKEKAELVVQWSPAITLKKGLKTLLKVSATELWS